jgi:hypothetical protein
MTAVLILFGVCVASLVIITGCALVFDIGTRRGWWQEDWT